MRPLLAALFVLALAGIAVAAPVAVLAYYDVIDPALVRSALVTAVSSAVALSVLGHGYLFVVPPLPPPARRAAPRRPGVSLDPQSFRSFVQVAALVVDGALLLAIAISLTSLVSMSGR